MLVFLYDAQSANHLASILPEESTIGKARTVGQWVSRPSLIRVPERHLLAESSGSTPMDLFRYELISRLYAHRWFWPPFDDFQWVNGSLACPTPQVLAELDALIQKQNQARKVRRVLIPIFNGRWQQAWSYVEKVEQSESLPAASDRTLSA
jgi:hypothetical protein